MQKEMWGGGTCPHCLCSFTEVGEIPWQGRRLGPGQEPGVSWQPRAVPSAHWLGPGGQEAGVIWQPRAVPSARWLSPGGQEGRVHYSL